jgi:hypothetical protein
MTWRGKTMRMDIINRNERVIINTLLTTNYIDITKPFQAKEALTAIRLQRKDDGKDVGNKIPNKFRLNYILKKCPQFTSKKNSQKLNEWVYVKDEEE